MLLVLSDVVRTHFFLPQPALLDPVVTSNEAMLRFEGFSGCCGVYARVDLPAEAFDSDIQGRGTTNVDFNNPTVFKFKVSYSVVYIPVNPDDFDTVHKDILSLTGVKIL